MPTSSSLIFIIVMALIDGEGQVTHPPRMSQMTPIEALNINHERVYIVE